VTFKVSNEGTAEATDTSTKLATTAKKKKKPKLVRTTTKKGGPADQGQGEAHQAGRREARREGQAQDQVAYIPDQGLAATKKLTLRG